MQLEYIISSLAGVVLGEGGMGLDPSRKPLTDMGQLCPVYVKQFHGHLSHIVNFALLHLSWQTYTGPHWYSSWRSAKVHNSEARIIKHSAVQQYPSSFSAMKPCGGALFMGNYLESHKTIKHLVVFLPCFNFSQYCDRDKHCIFPWVASAGRE